MVDHSKTPQEMRELAAGARVTVRRGGAPERKFDSKLYIEQMRALRGEEFRLR